ncbi:Hypothetical protein HVR_LOCUS419 [uncultured virus]|nr:Hypothetical protein HVR_LOCUS419 [uncultured virus]
MLVLSTLEKFEEYVSVINKEAVKYNFNPNTPTDIEDLFISEKNKKFSYGTEIIPLLRDSIQLLASEGILNYNMVVRIFLELIILLDRIRKARIVSLLSLKTSFDLFNIYDVFDNPFDIDNIITSIYSFDEKCKGLGIYLAPIISLSGAYGFNTFLFLFFNGIYAIGIGHKAMKAHGTEFPSLSDQINHDFNHITNLTRSYTENKERNLQLYQIHQQIFQRYHEFGLDKSMAFIGCIFWIIHEVADILKDHATATLSYTDCDFIQLLIVTERYGPEALGYDFSSEKLNSVENIRENCNEIHIKQHKERKKRLRTFRFDRIFFDGIIDNRKLLPHEKDKFERYKESEKELIYEIDGTEYLVDIELRRYIQDATILMEKDFKEAFGENAYMHNPFSSYEPEKYGDV